MSRTPNPLLTLKLGSCLAAAFLTLARAGDFTWDNAGGTITDATATTVSWDLANSWNPDGSSPQGLLDNAILLGTGLPATAGAGTVLNLDIVGVNRILNEFRQTAGSGTNPNNVTINIVNSGAAAGLQLNSIIHSAGGTLQFGPAAPITTTVNAYNPTGSLRVINTDDSATQLQGQLTVAGDFIKVGSGSVRLGTTGATFTNAIAGNIIVNNGTLEFANGTSGNTAGGGGKIILNAPAGTINWRPDGSRDYVRDIDFNTNFFTFSADRSTGSSTAQTVQTGFLNVIEDDGYLVLNSGNAYNYQFDGINLGNKILNIRNGLASNTTAHALVGSLSGAGTLNMSGAGGNSTTGLTFNAASPQFSGRVNLFEGGAHLLTATGAWGSGTVVLGEGSNTLPITYPNNPIGQSGSPTVLSNPWAAQLNYNANNPTTAPVGVTVNGASQVNMGVVPTAGDVIRLNPYGIIQGSSAELAGFTVGGNLLLPGSNAVIAHEALGGSDPAGLALTASHFYGLAANLDGALTVGSGTAWKGISNDRFGRNFAGASTVLTVNGGDNDPTTTEVTLAGLNGQNLVVFNGTGGAIASASGQKVSIAIEGYGSGFNGLGGGQAPGGNVRFERAASLTGLAANVDVVNVNSGNLQLASQTLGGVPLNINNNAGVDIIGAIGDALDGPVNVNNGGTLVLNDNALMNSGATPITVNAGGRLHITGSAPANILTGGSQPISFVGTGHTVRVSTDNVTNLDAAVPNNGAVWEIASNGTSNNVVNIWGTSFAVNSGRVVIQTAGLSTDGGVITNDNGGTRFLDAPLTIGNNGVTIAASTGTTLAFNDTATNTPVVVGVGGSAGTVPVQIGSTTPINGVTKTENPNERNNNADDILQPHNASPQVIFSNGLKSGTVTLTTGSLYLDGPAANTAIAGDLVMGPNTRLYIGDGGNIAFGNASTGAAPRRADLTSLLVAGTVTTTPGSKIILGNYSRSEMGVDITDPAYTASLVGGRGQVNQAFVITGEVNPDDRRSFWVNGVGGTASVDYNNVTIRNNGHLAFQESASDVRATVKLETSGTVSPFSAWDFKSIQNVDATGAPSTAAKTLTLGRENTAIQPMALYGAVDPGITLDNRYARFELRDGSSLPSNFVFNDNSAPRTVQSVQGTTNGGPTNGTDHTLSFVDGHDGITPVTNGTFNINRDNAVGGYVDEIAAGNAVVNPVGAKIAFNASGGTLFADRNNDSGVSGIVRYNDVQVNAPNVSLATRNGTDLEVGTLTASQNTVVRVDGARTDVNNDAVGAIRIQNVAAGANDVHFQNGRTTITGNVTGGTVTAGGTSLEFSPGTGNTSSVSATKVQVNTIVAAKSGTTDMGSAIIQSNAVGTTVAGLREGVISGGTINVGTANPANTAATANLYDSSNLGIRLDPRIAQNNYSATTTTDTAAGWSNNQTWVYTGQIYDADGIFTLAENIDDSVSIKIDGQVVLFSRNSGAAAATGSGGEAANGYTPPGGVDTTPGNTSQAPFESYRTVTNTSTKDGLSAGYWQASSIDQDLNGILADSTAKNVNEYGGTLNFGAGAGGWHDIEIRIQNGTGGASSPNTLGFGNYFGLGLNSNGTTSLLGTDYSKPIDNGSMNLFRTTTVAKGNVDVDNNANLSAGNLKTIGTLTFGRNGTGGNSTLTLTAGTAGDVDTISVEATAFNTATINVTNAAGKLTTGQFNLADSKVFNLNSQALSNGTLEITAGSAITANTGATISVEGGTLQLSNTSGSATGNALMLINAGRLAGNGITTSEVILNGGSISPGNSPGLLTVGNFSAVSGSFDFELNGTSAAANGSLYDVLSIAGSADLGAGGSTLNVTFGYTPTVGDNYFIVLNDGADPITNIGFTNALTEGSTFNVGPYTLQITFQANGLVAGGSTLSGGNDVALSVVAIVPEPGSLALLGVGLAGLLRRRRNGRA